MQKDLGCEDVPPNSYILIAPKGLPGPVFQRAQEVFKKASEQPDFLKIMEANNLPYEYKNRAQLEKDVPAQFEWYKDILQNGGSARNRLPGRIMPGGRSGEKGISAFPS
jgi:tripartite-type tricarboxylate transporter receptor subunit TctC